MLSYTDLSSEEFLSKGIKKSYQAILIPEIQQLIKTIDELHGTIQKMSQKEEELQHEIEVRDAQLNTPEHEVALAIKKMMQSTAESVVDTRHHLLFANKLLSIWKYQLKQKQNMTHIQDVVIHITHQLQKFHGSKFKLNNIKELNINKLYSTLFL